MFDLKFKRFDFFLSNHIYPFKSAKVVQHNTSDGNSSFEKKIQGIILNKFCGNQKIRELQNRLQQDNYSTKTTLIGSKSKKVNTIELNY